MLARRVGGKVRIANVLAKLSRSLKLKRLDERGSDGLGLGLSASERTRIEEEDVAKLVADRHSAEVVADHVSGNFGVVVSKAVVRRAADQGYSASVEGSAATGVCEQCLLSVRVRVLLPNTVTAVCTVL